MKLMGRLQDEQARKLALLWVVAILIRVVVMPFTMHFDAYQIYSRASEAAYDGQWFGWTAQFLVQGLHNVWLFLIRPLLPDSAGIWSDTASIAGVGASPEDYSRFLAYDHLYRLIFLMKLPYVVADLACAHLIGRLVEPTRRLAATAFWLLNPLVIYATAIYGRHDVLAILMVLAGLVVVRQATDPRRLVALALFGLATLTRFFPVVLIPFFLLAYRRNARQLAFAVGFLLAMAALVEVAGIAVAGQSPTLGILDTHLHFQNWLDAGVYLRFDDSIFFFPLIYTLGLLWLSERGISPEEFPGVGAVVFLVLFALTFFHPHYSIWLVPFLALTIANSRRMLVYHGIQIVCLLVYFAQWGSWTTWDLLQPLLGERVTSLPDPYEAIAGQIEPRLFFGAFRSVLTAVSFWMAWLLLKPMIGRSRERV